MLCAIAADVCSAAAAEGPVVIEGRFGKVEVDVNAPSLARLYLGGTGGLSTQSVLAQSGPRPWARGGYTYVAGGNEKRYESRLARPDKVEVSREGEGRVVRLMGVRLSAAKGGEPVATEDWTLSAPGDGSQLVWKIERRWTRDISIGLSGSPALFFSFDAPRSDNSVTNTIWYDPLRMAAGAGPGYAAHRMPGRISENHLQTIRDRDTWAVYKLWTNWHARSDLRLEVEGGHLYRRGGFALVSEAGAVTFPQATRDCVRGQVEQITLKIGSVDKAATGYQLAITLPDKTTEAAIKDFYGSVLNGGAVNDQKGFDFGNESDGWYYAGSSWMYGLALAAGTPAAGRLSSHPYDAASAFREHLAHILSTLDDKGRAHFGYNQGGEWVDDNLHTIIGACAYLLHSGDLAFVRQNLPAFERMLGYFIQRRNDQGLFRLDDVGAHWYYDAITTGGVNGYYNAFFYKAVCDLAEMEDASGRVGKAREYQVLAESIKVAFNQVFWREGLPGGPRYVDWIDAKGKEISYFCDLCQWPAVAMGIASPEQARKIVATADARIRQLEKEYGYQGFAGLSALWPVPAEINPCDWQKFGIYMNGGSLLCQTYWEITGRARAGDAAGAWRRLSRFAQRAAQISWAGDNAANINGEMKNGDGEPYLADMVVTTAAVVHGILGLRPTWQGIEVKPCLPAGWPGAEAEVLYKGRRHRVRVEGNKAEVEPLGQVITPRLLWVMDANWRATPGGTAALSSVGLGDGGSISLKRIYDDRGALGLWKLDEEAGAACDASPHENHGTLNGKGILRGQPGRRDGSRCYRFDGNGVVTVPDTGDLTFGRTDSFTVQCWFRTEAADSRVMIGKSMAYCVYVKNGRLAAWLMQEGGQFREALGSRRVADGTWHHVAAVYDRLTQRISLYADGRLDTPNGTPDRENPADISPIGPSASHAEVNLGGLAGGYRFTGALDEVSISRGALKAEEFSVDRDYPSPCGSRKVEYAGSGSYVSPTYDWAERVKLDNMTLSADLNGGGVTATIQTSDDGFNTIRGSIRLAVSDSVSTYSLDPLPGKARMVRVRFDLTPSGGGTTTPVIDALRMTGEPAE
jgi:hypothetical protein